MIQGLLKEFRTVRKSPVAKNAGWMMAGQGTSVLLQAAYFIILARLLGAVQYGIFAGAFALTSLASQYSPLGTGTLFLRYVSQEREKWTIYWGNILLVTTGLGGAITLIMTLLAPHLINAESAKLVVWASLANCIFSQLTIEVGRVFQTFEKLRVTAILNLLTNSARALAAGVLLFVLDRASAKLWAITSSCVSCLVTFIAIAAVVRFLGFPRFQFGLLKKHAWEGFGYSFASSTASAYNDLDKTMLSHYGMNLETGIYTMAYRVVDIVTLPIFAIRDAALPRLFQRGQVSIDAASELAFRLLKRTITISVGLSAATFVCAPFIPLVVGGSFAASVPALRWLSLIPVFRCVHQMTGSALTASGRQNQRTAMQLLAAALNFGLNLWLIPSHGWHGAAWSSVATDGALSVANWSVLRYAIAHSRERGATVDEN